MRRPRQNRKAPASHGERRLSASSAVISYKGAGEEFAPSARPLTGVADGRHGGQAPRGPEWKEARGCGAPLYIGSTSTT